MIVDDISFQFLKNILISKISKSYIPKINKIVKEAQEEPHNTSTHAKVADAWLIDDMSIKRTFPDRLSIHTPAHKNSPTGAPHALNP
jgi:hypothetical protein